MSESEFESSENSEEEEKEEEKQKRPQMSTLYTKLGVTKNTLGMKRSFQSYQPTANKPFKRPALKLNNGPLNNHNLSAVPFKMPTFIKKTNFHLGSLRPGTTLGMRRATKVKMHSLYDPNAEGAFVIYRPKITLSETEKEARMTKLGGKPPDFEVEVVVDPILAAVLRPHQKAGVQFLYDCTTGLKSENAFGCIMADEMGLGKSLQCITLLWTLLKQSPIPGIPTVEKAIIACPSSLVKNWGNELTKWLGEGRVRPYSCDNKGTKEQTTKDILNFVTSKGRSIVNPVLIVSYETLRIYCNELQKTEIGLLLCDEGHRLKNADNQTYKALNSLNAKRRVILSGTPIQNDLTEYFSLASFVIPNLLGTNAEFRKNFELPILRGRDADATEVVRKKSEEKLVELGEAVSKFIIRRTADLLTKYLPTKYEYVVFAKMTDFQQKVYQHYSKKEMKRLNREESDAPKSKGGTTTLQAMTTMKKIVNHPGLLDPDSIPSELLAPGFMYGECLTEFSGKFLLLEQMLRQMRSESNDKIVLISNYTQTLDFMTKLAISRKWPHCRLDGSMSIRNRQKIVDKFNDPAQPEFIFLLSSKAGGCGINLIGANRLILFDPDWNPANDAQAMARVWRDGQKKTCFLYRFITTGSIEEKIFQRQAHKQSLSSCVVDAEQDVERHFTLESLRQLFDYNDKTNCDTHDTFKCKRCSKGKQLIKPPSGEGQINTGATALDTSTWNHFSPLELHKIVDKVLCQQAKDTKAVTFVFQNKSHESLFQ